MMNQFLIFMAIVALNQAQPFHIPLPLGAGIDVNKQPDGQTQVSLGQNVNILGFGGNRNLTFSGGNGTFSTQTDGNLLVNGTKIGGGSTIGADKNKGVTLDNDVNLGNKTIQGGVGKEGNFITQLIDAIKEETQKNKAKKTNA